MASEFALERIYVKDLSFESPRSPDVFRGQWQPGVHLDINSRANALGDDRFEVVLTVTANVRGPETVTNAIIEVQQAGLFRIKGMPDDQRTRMLATFCPNLLFPYAREAIDGMMVRGALPPLYLAPVNFDALFEEALKRRAAQQAEAAPGTSKGSTQH